MNDDAINPPVLKSDLDSAIKDVEGRLRPGWLQKNAPVISAVAAVIALGVAAWYYVSQVGLTQQSLLTSQHSLQNSLIYQMQKDQRAAVIDYSSGRLGPEYIFAQMQSVYLQHELGSIPKDVWPSFLRDFCNLDFGAF